MDNLDSGNGLPIVAYQQDGDSLPMSAPPAQIPLTEPALTDRTYKATVGIGPVIEKGSGEIYSSLLNGKEDQLRSEAAAKLEDNRASIRQEKLTDALKKNTGTNTPDAISNLLGTDVINYLNPKPIDPNTVIEKTWALNSVDSLDRASDNVTGFWNQFSMEYPKILNQEKDHGTDVLSKHAYVVTKKQNLDEEVANAPSPTEGLPESLTSEFPELAPGVQKAYQVAGRILPMLFQPFQELLLRGRGNTGFLGGTGEAGESTTLGGIGGNLEQQRINNYKLPFDKFTDQIDKDVNQLKAINPMLAQMYLQSMAGVTTEDRSLNDLFTLGSVAGGLATTAKVAGKTLRALKGWSDVRSATKDIVQAASSNPEPTNVIAAAGDVGDSAVKKQSLRIIQGAQAPLDPVKDIKSSMVSALDTDAKDINQEPGRLGRALSNMLEQQYNYAKEAFTTVLNNVTKVQRIPFERATEEQLQQMRTQVKFDNPELSNAILDISNPKYNDLTNTWYHDLLIGKPGAELFPSFNVANSFKTVQGLEDAKIVKQGLGYYLAVRKPINEEGELAKSLLVTPNFGKTPEQGLVKSAISWLITPDNTTSLADRISRKVATYAQSEISKLADTERQYIQNVKNGYVVTNPLTGEKISPWLRKPANAFRYLVRTPNKRWQELERTLEHNQYMPDPERPGENGMFFKNPAQLENHYLASFNRMPDYDEIQAYFAHKRLYELDRQSRNYAVYRNKVRLGAETHSFSVVRDGQKIDSPEFDGMRMQYLPKTEDTAVFIGPSGVGRITRANKLAQTELEDTYKTINGKNVLSKKGINTRIKEGELKAVRVYDPETNPLAGFDNLTNERVRYVVTPNLNSKEIAWDQVPRRGGGHFEYEYDHYIKQARVRAENVNGEFTHWYEGDNTVMPVAIRRMGEDVAKRMNSVRELIHNGLEDEARQALEDKPFGIDWETFRDWFKGKGGQPARLSTSEPIQVVSKNKSIIDKGKDALERRYEYKDAQGRTYTTLKDGTRQGSDARQYQVAYTRERDAHEMTTVNNVGSASRPIYTASPAKLVDPIPMMNRSLSKVINSMLMDDYKISAIERWIEEARPYLDTSDSELLHAPFYWFQQPRYKTDIPLEKRLALMGNHYKIQQFAGMPSEVDRWLHAAGQKLADVSYDRFGPKVAMIPAWLIPRATNPIQLARTMTYHAKLGLFAIPQLAVQNMSWVNMAAMAPAMTAKAIPATFFHQWSRLNSSPEWIKTMSGYMEKFGWRPGEWAEALAEGHKTGFFHVGGEYINLDNMSRYRLIRGIGADTLQAGQIPFKEGEANVRFGAWYASFKEWRDANPVAKITDASRGEILNRADDLYQNMSRASASFMHVGPLALTTQFLSYQLRLSELFFSKRLGDTLLERNAARTRLFLFNALAFGAPLGAGVVGYPAGQAIRSFAIDKGGYVPGENIFYTAIMEGLPSLAIGKLTGRYYNFGERMGNQGYEAIKDILYGDKTFLGILSGAAGSVLGNALASFDPFVKYFEAWWNGYPYSITADNLMGPFKEIQSVNAAWTGIMIHNTGNLLTKNGTPVVPATMKDAFMNFAFGLKPQSYSDTYLKANDMKNSLELQKHVIHKMSDLIRSAQMDYSNQNISGGDATMDQARAYGMLAFGTEGNVDAFSQAWSEAYNDADKTLRDKIDWDYVWKNSNMRSTLDIVMRRNPDKLGGRLEQWQKTQQLKKQNGEQ